MPVHRVRLRPCVSLPPSGDRMACVCRRDVVPSLSTSAAFAGVAPSKCPPRAKRAAHRMCVDCTKYATPSIGMGHDRERRARREPSQPLVVGGEHRLCERTDEPSGIRWIRFHSVSCCWYSWKCRRMRRTPDARREGTNAARARISMRIESIDNGLGTREGAASERALHC